MFVKPAPHPEQEDARLKVRHPRTYAFLHEAGEEVPENRWWLRRLRQGDVVLAKPLAPHPESSDPPAEPAPAITHEGASA